MTQRRKLLAGGIGVTVVLVLAGGTSASGADRPDSPEVEAANVIAGQISEVAPDAGEVLEGQRVGGASVAETRSATVEVRLDSPSQIDVVAEGGGGEIAATITLPRGFARGPGTIADDGTVVFRSDHGGRGSLGDAIAVQTLTDGSTRVQTVLATAESEHEFGYGMAGFSPVVTPEDGTFFVSDSGAVVPVDAAWAVDAKGEPVATHYEVRGAELVQVVEPDADAVYPIVADPSWQWINAGWGMKLTRDETRQSANYATAGAMCIAFVKRAAALGIACGVYAGYIMAQANIANGENPKTCLFFDVVPAPGTIWRVRC
jgi:hypothetical protein